MFPSNFSGFPNFRSVGVACAIVFCGGGGGGDGVGEGGGGGVANLSGVGCLVGGGDASGTFGKRELGPGSENPKIALSTDGVVGVGWSDAEVESGGATLGVGGWKNRDSTDFLVSFQYQRLFELDH